jgi:hypothetical protein
VSERPNIEGEEFHALQTVALTVFGMMTFTAASERTSPQRGLCTTSCGIRLAKKESTKLVAALTRRVSHSTRPSLLWHNTVLSSKSVHAMMISTHLLGASSDTDSNKNRKLFSVHYRTLTFSNILQVGDVYLCIAFRARSLLRNHIRLNIVIYRGT